MYFDLYKSSCDDQAFRTHSNEVGAAFRVAVAKATTSSEARDEANSILRAYWHYCGQNSFYLVGTYFPKFPQGKRMSFIDYPFAWAMLNFQIGEFTVLRGSRQIAKSTALSVRQVLNAHFMPGLKSLYVTPRGQQLATYANKLRETERACTLYRPDSKFRLNLRFKEFANGSQIELLHILSEAGPARGKSTDELLYDEFQDFDMDLETEVQQCQSASTNPVTIFSGTSLTTETALEAKFAQSSQGYWSIRCSCGNWNIPLPEYNVLDMIRPKGPSCVKCSRLLNVYSGQFVHAKPELLAQKQVGFHVPQIIVPAVVNNKNRWDSIVRLLKSTQNIKKFYQELLGLPTEEGVREITRKNLEDMCTLGEQEALQKRARAKGYEWVISGCDWGGTDPSIEHKLRVSTTVHAVLGIRAGTHEFDIIHMRRYEGMDYDSISADICMNHLALGGYAIATDVGVGMAYNSAIRKLIPSERHLMIRYMGPTAAYFNESDSPHTINEWQLNKTESITDLYNAVKRGRIRCYKWDQAQPMLLDFLNVFRAPCESPGGVTTMRYLPSATKPSDTIQAVNYAYVLGRLLLGEPLIADDSIRLRFEHTLRGTAIDMIMNLPGAISR